MKQSIQYGIVWLLGIALMSPLFGWSQGLITGTVSDENGIATTKININEILVTNKNSEQVLPFH